MFHFFKKLFKAKPYTFLGKGGISYVSGGDKFYIDTNNFVKGPYSVEIFYEDIKKLNSTEELSKSEKKELAIIVKNVLALDGISADIR